MCSHHCPPLFLPLPTHVCIHGFLSVFRECTLSQALLSMQNKHVPNTKDPECWPGRDTAQTSAVCLMYWWRMPGEKAWQGRGVRAEAGCSFLIRVPLVHCLAFLTELLLLTWVTVLTVWS
jgi:hypothetical protein